MPEQLERLKRFRQAKQFLTALVFLLILIFGWRYPVLGFFIPLCMLAGIAFGVRRGRVWCNWYCPRGSFYDCLVSLVSPKKEIPAVFKNIRFRIFVIVLLLSIMLANLIRLWPDIVSIGKFFLIMLTVTTAIGIILALFFHQRSWCMICPIGTVLNLIGRSKYPLLIDSQSCIDCKACANACPVQIKPYAYKAEGRRMVREADCLKCDLCIAACPKKALSR